MSEERQDYPTLDPAQFPLSELRLIEASAGTGKTYAIANLVVRLVVESGLGVERILVVTFTRAATEELRGRVRERIRDALRAFEQRDAETEDGFLRTLKQRCPDGALRLKLALQSMDESAIYTIHGFCQRVLSDNAFESGSGFEMDFVNDDQEYRLQIMRDFWRRHCYALDSDVAEWLLQAWSGPDALLQDVAGLLIHPRLDILPQVDVDFGRAREQFNPLLETLNAQWPGAHNDLVEWLGAYKGLSHAANSYRPDMVEEAGAQVDAYLAQARPDLQLPPNFKLFTRAFIKSSMNKSATKKGIEAPDHKLFDVCGRMWDLAEQLRERFLIDLRIKALAFCRRELEQRKQAAQVLSPDDLLTRTHAALQSVHAPALAERVRSAYPVALIDEFQDTDPLQYEIFHGIYQGQAANALIMIGDPKQAIYGFRGADIFTYLRAAKTTAGAGEPYSLDTNWRSTNGLVQAVNILFGQGQPFVLDDAIRYQSVKASGRADEEPLLVEGDSAAAMHFWQLSGSAKASGMPQTEYGPLIAEGFAAEIARLLTLGAEGKARIGAANLQAKDIAVLVRDRYEAVSIQQALRACGVGSAYISRDNVFYSEQAKALLTLLQAVLAEGKESLLRPALSGPILGWDMTSLEHLARDESALETLQERFRNYAKRWRRLGLMPMLSRLLHEEGVPARFLGLPDGERVLTNLRHLGELLQAASDQAQGGPEGLLRWYRDELASGGSAAEEALLRLESDENLVQIVTLHKSKGLQYPVVFLPFPWRARPFTDKSKSLLFHAGEEDRLTMDLGSDDFSQHIALADRERLAEDMRLLYVALTRAQYRIYATWGCFKDMDASAFAHLLGERTPEELSKAHADVFAVVSLPHDDAARLSQTGGAASGEGLRRFERRLYDDWRISSYSSLISDSSGRREDAPERPDFDAAEEPAGVLAEPMAEPQGIFAFPRGARAGQCLHGILEAMDFQGEDGPEFRALVERQLLRQGLPAHWRDMLAQWLWRLPEVILDEASGLTLGHIDKASRIAEMGFHLPLQPLHAEDLRDLLDEWRGARGPKLDFAPVQGMLNGFIDLIIQHQGRYFVIDYKSNHLGNRHQDYSQTAMDKAVRAHQYDLQYLIYCVALHRYLRYRQPDYDFEQHFGGVFYLFLRGMQPAGGDTGVYRDRPAKTLIESLDRLFGAPAKEDATC